MSIAGLLDVNWPFKVDINQPPLKKGAEHVTKWIISSCMGAMLALSIGAVATAQDPGNGNGVGEYCKPLTEAFGVTNDLCVNCVNGGDDFAVCICKNAGLFLGDPYLGYPNLGQCVSAVRKYGY